MCVGGSGGGSKAEKTEINCSADLYILKSCNQFSSTDVPPNPHVPETLCHEIQPRQPTVRIGDSLTGPVCPTYVMHQLCFCLFVCAVAVRVGGSATIYLCAERSLVSVYMPERTYGGSCALGNNLCLVGRVFSSLLILNLMMQAHAEHQSGILIPGPRLLILPCIKLSCFSVSLSSRTTSGTGMV